MAHDTAFIFLEDVPNVLNLQLDFIQFRETFDIN